MVGQARQRAIATVGGVPSKVDGCAPRAQNVTLRPRRGLHESFHQLGIPIKFITPQPFESILILKKAQRNLWDDARRALRGWSVGGGVARIADVEEEAVAPPRAPQHIRCQSLLICGELPGGHPRLHGRHLPEGPFSALRMLHFGSYRGVYTLKLSKSHQFD